MTEELFKILFRGDISEGFQRGDVKAKLVELFGLKEQTVDALLDGQTATLKKNLNREGALKFKQAFEQTGAICYIRPMEESAATSAPKPPSTPWTNAPPQTSGVNAADRREPEGFSVVDTAPQEEAKEEPEPVFEIPTGPSPGTMSCPKCAFVQPTADFCEACGVVILKYLKRQWEEERLAKQLEASQPAEESRPSDTRPEPQPTAQPEQVKAGPKIEVSPPGEVEAQEVSGETEAFTVIDAGAPTETAPAEAETDPEPVLEIPAGPSPGTMSCPKCEFVQARADFCEACGVVILKFLKRQWEEEQLARQLEKAQQEAQSPPAVTPPEKPAPNEQGQPQQAATQAQTSPAVEAVDSESEAFTVVPPASTPAQPAPKVPTQTVPEPDPEPEPIAIPAGPTPGTMSCPKCEFVQPVGDCCEACGIAVLKYLQRQAADREQSASPASDEETDKEADLESLRAIFSEADETSSPPLEMTPSGSRLPPEEPFTSIRRRSWKLLQSNSRQLIPLWLGTLAMIALLSAYHSTVNETLGAPFAPLTTGLAILLTLSLAINATLFLFADPYLTLKPALAIGLMRLPSFLWLHFCLTLVLGGTTLALLVPGYFFARWFCLAPSCYAAEQTRGLSCLLRSRAYSRGREKRISRALLPASLLPLTTLAAVVVLPGYWKLLGLLAIPPFLAALAILFQDAADSRPTLSYDDTFAQRLQWPIFSLAGLLIFVIAALLTLGAGRIHSVTYSFMLQAGLVAPEAEVSTSSGQKKTQQVLDSGVFEFELEGYQAYAYLNGELIKEYPGGVLSRRTSSTPIKFKPGRNLLAIRYTALDGAVQPEMKFRVFRWDIKTLKDVNYGRWLINDRSGLRRFEFNVARSHPGSR